MEYVVIAAVFLVGVVLRVVFGSAGNSQEVHEASSNDISDLYKWERTNKDFSQESWDIRYNDEFLD